MKIYFRINAFNYIYHLIYFLNNISEHSESHIEVLILVTSLPALFHTEETHHAMFHHFHTLLWKTIRAKTRPTHRYIWKLRLQSQNHLLEMCVCVRVCTAFHQYDHRSMIVFNLIYLKVMRCVNDCSQNKTSQRRKLEDNKHGGK